MIKSWSFWNALRESLSFVQGNFRKLATKLTKPGGVQNEEIFILLDELDELDRGAHAWITIHLQPHISTENILA